MSNCEEWAQPEEETELQLLVEWEEWIGWARSQLEPEESYPKY